MGKVKMENTLLRNLYLLLFALACSAGHGQNKWSTDLPSKEAKEMVYKVVNGDTLKLQLYMPDKVKRGKRYPAVVYYFGGGWNGGSWNQFRDQAGYFASRGMVTVLVDYRVKSRQGTTPYEAVADAKSAIRFLRSRADEFQIDPDRVVAAGGSAGGHLAAATALLPSLDEKGEDLSISSKANAMILYNAVVDNGPDPDGFQHERMGPRYLEISPMHNIENGAPPALFLLGSEDHLIPVSVADKFKAKMDSVGSRSDVFIYEGQGHGFFNKKEDTDEYYVKTTLEADKFLKSLGYIKGKPTL